ncbi:unnamed protein product [Linum tenue]|uniref:Uncharacterized protein n=1 Tax=Linum tenue TaxID=586396 RepID=A0AAV0KQ48_9ROSI|nr:unnamed protein product [Linum tenue]
MSLVDYASSSDDEESPEAKVAEGPQAPKPEPSPPPVAILPTTQMHGSSSNRLPPPLLPGKLPDASLLLNSPSSSSSVGGADHRSWVGVDNLSLKRDSAGQPNSSRRSKLPKGNSLLHTKNTPDTSSGVLVPPQLRGRSNVVTEDVGKLFVKRPASSPSQ